MDSNEILLKELFKKLLQDNPRYAEYGIGKLGKSFKAEREVLEKSFDAFKLALRFLQNMNKKEVCLKNNAQHADILSRTLGIYIPQGAFTLAAKSLGFKIVKFKYIPATLFELPREKKIG